MRPVRLLCSLRTVMTCALPALVLTISGWRFRIMPALFAAFCPERCRWPGCPQWSSLLTGRSLSSRIRGRLVRLRPRQSGPPWTYLWCLGGDPSGTDPRDCPLSGSAFDGAGPDESPPSVSPGGWWTWFGLRCLSGGAGEPVSAAIRTALGRLQLDVPPAQSSPFSAFFRRRDAKAAFVVPPSAEYVQELHACWTDTRAFSRLTADGRALAAMQEAPKFGLDCMPPVESAIASLIVPPDEVLRPNAHCPCCGKFF
ncbi:hypothetical protein GOODEAATRI_016333 [Goodea atripinnis]|uniref:Uncharacterized protein n=1 Tax=Goodea atripinnis TaxID=208336 RepID=A0ABV0PEL1_9TELE